MRSTACALALSLCASPAFAMTGGELKTICATERQVCDGIVRGYVDMIQFDNFRCRETDVKIASLRQSIVDQIGANPHAPAAGVATGVIVKQLACEPK